MPQATDDSQLNVDILMVTTTKVISMVSTHVVFYAINPDFVLPAKIHAHGN